MTARYRSTTRSVLYGSVLLISLWLQGSIATNKTGLQQWGEWAPWTECSVQCGQGISSRSRQCFRGAAPVQHTSVLSENSTGCLGASLQVKVCILEACPPEQPSSRQRSCSQYDSRVFSGRQYTWEPFIHSTNPCKVSCRAKGVDFYANLADKVEDGTACKLGLTNAVCVRGECKPVGCDGVVESGALKDVCGVCRGDSSTCRTISGIFTSTDLKRGLNYVISIPPGSTNINITELQTSRNLLILQTITGETFINNDTSSPSSSIVNAAGTVFSYIARSPSNPREIIHSSGPTNMTIVLKLLLRGNNPGIMYTFSVPIEVSDTVIQQIRHRTQPVELPPDSDSDHHTQFQAVISKNNASGLFQDSAAQFRTTLSPDSEPLERMNEENSRDSHMKKTSTSATLNKVTPANLISDHENVVEKYSSSFYNKNSDIVPKKENWPTSTHYFGYEPLEVTTEKTPSAQPLSSPSTPDDEKKLLNEDLAKDSNVTKLSSDTLFNYSNSIDTHYTDSDLALDSKKNESELIDHRIGANNDHLQTQRGEVSERSTQFLTSVAGPSEAGDNRARNSNYQKKYKLQSSYDVQSNFPQNGSEEPKLYIADTEESGSWKNSKIHPTSDISNNSNQYQTNPHGSVLNKYVNSEVDTAQASRSHIYQNSTSNEEIQHPRSQTSQTDNSRFSIPRYSQSFTFGEKYKDIYSRNNSRRSAHRTRQRNRAHRIYRHQQSTSQISQETNVTASHHKQHHINSGGQHEHAQNANSGYVPYSYRHDKDQGGDHSKDSSKLRTFDRSGHRGATEGHENNGDEQISREMRLRDRQALIDERRRRVEEQILQYNERLREYQQKLKQRMDESHRRGSQASNAHVRTPDTLNSNVNNRHRRPNHYDSYPSSSSRANTSSSLQHGSESSGSGAKLHPPHLNFNDSTEKTKGFRWSAVRNDNTFVRPDHISVTSTSSPYAETWLRENLQQRPLTSSHTDNSWRRPVQSREDLKSHSVNSNSRTFGSDTPQQSKNRQESSQYGPRIIPPPQLEHPDFVEGDKTGSYPPQAIPRLQPSPPRYIPGPPSRSASYSALTAQEKESRPSPNQIADNSHISPNRLPIGYNQAGSVDSLPNQISLNVPAPAQNIHSTVYEWRVSGLTECTHSCGGGIQQTVVLCVDIKTQAVVTDENCRHIPKHRIFSVPCNTRPCSAEWTPGPWSSCTVTCGKGEQTRTVTCQARVSPTLNMTMPNSNCESQERIPTRQTCSNNLCSSWRIGTWSNCSTPCGDGQRIREVQCVDLQNNVVSDDLCLELRPVSEDHCNLGECGKGWFFTEWPSECPAECGVGEMTRRVFCADDEGVAVPDSRCDKNQQPSAKQPCRASRPCGGVWFAGPWSKCESTCGSGKRHRSVLCIKELPGNVRVIVGEENCEGVAKPTETEPCEAAASCTPEWYMASWSECSKSCGTGYKTREVKCLGPDQNPHDECPLETRPKTRDACNTHDCADVQNKVDEEDPDCTDKFNQCKVVKRARLCRYKYYKTVCCKSCADDT